VNTTNLLDAIRVVKENERIASEKYANAAQMLGQVGKELFLQLSEFEQFHYERITALEKSLLEKGDYISYEGKEFPLPPIFDVKAAEEPNKKSTMQIITEALELEKQAEKAYSDLASHISEPLGHQMFLRLSEEEHNHYRILSKAYWSLNDSGVWKW
jgi:rubrerythrin